MTRRLALAVFALPALALAATASAGPGGGKGKPVKGDTTSPAIAIVTPSDGATLTGTVTVAGTASDSTQLAKVEVGVDGGAYQPAQGTTSWTDSLDTTGLSNGTHTITARATDTAGNASTVSESVSVSNPVIDTTPPTVAISSPSSGATVQGTITVVGSASDNVQVAKVELAVDGGAYQPAQGTTSWTSTLDTTGLFNGTHTITARATDAAGNSSTASVSAGVGNLVADTTVPTVAITSPSAGATVQGTITVGGGASDNVQVAKVELAVDGGTYQLAQGTSSWSYSLSTTPLSNGSHSITARATDTSGNVATTSETVNVSNALPAGVKEQLVTPEGATIQIYSDVSGWTAQKVYELLKPSAYQLDLIGPDLTVKVQNQTSSSTAASAGTTGTVYTSYRATISLGAAADSTFTAQPERVVAHEYGHAWTLYHLYLTQQNDWSSYLVARGLAGDPRLESSFIWSKREIIADDYRLLFGSDEAIAEAPQHLNPYIADPRDVPGLKNWFVTVWAAV